MKNRTRRTAAALAIAGLAATAVVSPATAADQPLLKSGKNAVQRVEAQVEQEAGHNLVNIEFPEDANNVAHVSQAEEFSGEDEELVNKVFEALEVNGFDQITYLPLPLVAVLPLGPVLDVDPDFSVVDADGNPLDPGSFPKPSLPGTIRPMPDDLIDPGFSMIQVETHSASFIDPGFSVIPLQELIDPDFSVAGPDGLPLRGDDKVKTIYRPDSEQAQERPGYIQSGRLAVNRVKCELEQEAGHKIATLDFNEDDPHAVTVRKSASFEESDAQALEQIFDVLELNGFDKISYIDNAETAEELPVAEFPIA